MVKVGLIGCGAMGTFHATELMKLETVKFVTCCDVVAERATALAERVGARACTDYRQVLDEVEAVWVCTEPFNRVDIVLDAASAGKHIFTEKPICLTLADADRMIEAARHAGVKYALGYCLRFWQPYKIMRETFACGELGELLNCWTRRYMPIDMRGLWYGKQQLSGGVSLDFGSHDIDWLTWIGGRAKIVFAKTLRVRQGVEADEHCQCLLVFAAGGMGALDVSWWETIGESSLGIVGTKGSMMVGRDGAVKKKLLGQEETTVEVASAMAVDPTGRLGQRDEEGQIQAVATPEETIQQHVIRCIEQDIEPVVDARIGRQALETVLAIRRSAETGRAVELPAAPQRR